MGCRILNVPGKHLHWFTAYPQKKNKGELKTLLVYLRITELFRLERSARAG